jgi:hypothetical protein
MRDFVRLQLIAKVSYYFGWFALFCGGLVQINIGRGVFLAMNVSRRNLFEASVVCFLICMASELQVLASGKTEVSSGMLPTIVKKQAAA